MWKVSTNTTKYGSISMDETEKITQISFLNYFYQS